MHRIIAIIVGFVTGGLRIITLYADSEVGQATAWNEPLDVLFIPNCY
jgi:hypothetical protein